MASRPCTRWSALLASTLVIACDRHGVTPPPRRRVDASVRAIDTGPTIRAAAAPGPIDAGSPTPDAGPPRSPIDLFVAGGGDLARPGTTLPMRVERAVPGDAHIADVTSTATFRVEPPTVGRVEAGGTFRALAVGRAIVIATLGADEARTIIEVTSDLPAGVNSLPTVQVSGVRVVRSVRFGALPDGTVLFEVQAAGLSAALRGRRRGNTFPMTVAMVENPVGPTGDVRDASVGPSVTGTLVLDRWIDRRLFGRASLQVGGRPVQVRFTMLLGDASALLLRVGP